MLIELNQDKLEAFRNRPILAVDYGQKVIGTSKFTPRVDPYPLMLSKIIVSSNEQVLKEIRLLIEQESIEIIVVGIPYFTDGGSSDQTLINKKFFELLKTTFSNIEFFEQDETLTTKEAEDRMKNSPQFNFKIDRTQIDCLSAVIILEDFLK